MIPEEAKKLFITKYSSFGNDKFYKFLLNYAVNRIVSNEEIKKDNPKADIAGVSPEAELMDYHDRFLLLHRRENETVYLDIAKLFRKAGHKIYRIMLKKEMIDKSNRFLNLVG